MAEHLCQSVNTYKTRLAPKLRTPDESLAWISYRAIAHLWREEVDIDDRLPRALPLLHRRPVLLHVRLIPVHQIIRKANELQA